MIATLLGLFTGGGATLLALLGKIVPGLATAIGDVWIKSKQTQVESDKVGVSASHEYLTAVTEANRSRVEARRAEGAWGPLGLVTIGIGAVVIWTIGVFSFHVTLIVLDSTPWSLFGIFDPHVIGSWRVAPLPKPFDAIELTVLNAMVSTINALFYTAPPAAAAVAIGRMFRR